MDTPTPDMRSFVANIEKQYTDAEAQQARAIAALASIEARISSARFEVDKKYRDTRQSLLQDIELTNDLLVAAVCSDVSPDREALENRKQALQKKYELHQASYTPEIEMVAAQFHEALATAREALRTIANEVEALRLRRQEAVDRLTRYELSTLIGQRTVTIIPDVQRVVLTEDADADAHATVERIKKKFRDLQTAATDASARVELLESQLRLSRAEVEQENRPKKEHAIGIFRRADADYKRAVECRAGNLTEFAAALAAAHLTSDEAAYAYDCKVRAVEARFAALLSVARDDYKATKEALDQMRSCHNDAVSRYEAMIVNKSFARMAEAESERPPEGATLYPSLEDHIAALKQELLAAEEVVINSKSDAYHVCEIAKMNEKHARARYIAAVEQYDARVFDVSARKTGTKRPSTPSERSVKRVIAGIISDD
jgi:hypothetical protein